MRVALDRPRAWPAVQCTARPSWRDGASATWLRRRRIAPKPAPEGGYSNYPGRLTEECNTARVKVVMLTSWQAASGCRSSAAAATTTRIGVGSGSSNAAATNASPTNTGSDGGESNSESQINLPDLAEQPSLIERLDRFGWQRREQRKGGCHSSGTQIVSCRSRESCALVGRARMSFGAAFAWLKRRQVAAESTARKLPSARSASRFRDLCQSDCERPTIVSLV